VPSDIAIAQQRALDDAWARWHEAIAALDLAQAQAENLHDASPQLLADDLFYPALNGFRRTARMLTGLIEAVSEEGP
jgi:hypothetical protein